MLSNKHFSFLLAAVLTICCFIPSFAQEEMKDQLFWVREEVAKVDMSSQYEETSKEWVKLMEEGGLDISEVRASQRDDFHYYYLIPLENYAEIDNFGAKFGEAIEKIGNDKWSSFSKRNDESMVSHKDMLVKWSASLSYVPAERRTKPEESEFLHWIFFDYKLEKRSEVMSVLKEWKELYSNKNIPDGYSVWLMQVGDDNNMIVITESAKNGGEFYKAMEENSSKIKTEEQKLWAKFVPNIISMEQKYGAPRPDLSYFKK